MAGNNRAVEGPVITDPPPVPPGTQIEGLPATGVWGKNPAMVIGVIMFVAKFAVAYAVTHGYTPPVGPEIQSLADRFGYDATSAFVSFIFASPALIQGFWTKMRVFAPRSVYKRYFLPLFDKK
jgi:hypothetical protein